MDLCLPFTWDLIAPLLSTTINTREKFYFRKERTSLDGQACCNVHLISTKLLQVTTDLLTRGGKDIAFSDYSPLWKQHRRLVHNSFTLFGEGTSRLQDIVLAEVDSLCEELLAYRGRSVDPYPAITRAVTNVVCTLVFNATYGPGDAELQEVIEYNNGIVQTITKGGLVDIFPWMKVFPNKCLKKLKECIVVRDRLLDRKLKEHKASLSEGEPRDLLDALVKGQMSDTQGQRSAASDEEGITDDHMLMTAAEAFGAGVETTSTTLLWILAYLLHHPEVQERVQKELDEKVGSERQVCVSDRGRLSYLDAVICEGMRIRPVSPVLIPHTAMTDSRQHRRPRCPSRDSCFGQPVVNPSRPPTLGQTRLVLTRAFPGRRRTEGHAHLLSALRCRPSGLCRGVPRQSGAFPLPVFAAPENELPAARR
ncbi:cytochrome P450 17A2 isoform 3-T3 [Synchiropus picturatus]